LKWSGDRDACAKSLSRVRRECKCSMSAVPEARDSVAAYCDSFLNRCAEAMRDGVLR
jgi:hypothetical protein